MKYVLLCLLLAAAHAVRAQKDEDSIKAVLQRQTAAWNSGSVEAFMAGYWQSDSLMFIGQNGIRHGYQTTLENYKKSYPDTAAMGRLRLNLLELRRLSPQYYFVTGQWYLTRSMGNLNGYFTLLLRKIKGRWVVVADHSS